MSDMWNPPRVMTHRLRTTDLDEVVSLDYLWNKVQGRRSIPRLCWNGSSSYKAGETSAHHTSPRHQTRLGSPEKQSWQLAVQGRKVACTSKWHNLPTSEWKTAVPKPRKDEYFHPAFTCNPLSRATSWGTWWGRPIFSTVSLEDYLAHLQDNILVCPNVSLKAGTSLKGRALPHYWSSSPVHPHPFTACCRTSHRNPKMKLPRFQFPL